MKNIKDIIKTDYDIKISGITDDSRKIEKDFVFVATKGFNVDHFDYIKSAIEKGCSIVISNRKISYDFPNIIVDDIDKTYDDLCRKFYDIDLDSYNLIAITGTDGKTTTTTIIENILDDYAYLGTNGLKINNKTFNTDNTTPPLNELYNCFKLTKENNISNIVMEVSSEALLHHRVDSLSFEIIGFTNITGDHLQVHGSFDNYINSKMKLLDLVKNNGYVVINGDDIILQNIKHHNLVTFGFNENNDYYIKEYKQIDKNALVTLIHKNKKYLIKTPLIGKHNIYNVVMAFIIGLLKGIKAETLLKRIQDLKEVPGRLEFLDFGQKFDIVLDYAHTINGIKNILDTFKDYKNIIVVTGCAGRRDKYKRRIIGKMIMEKANLSIFTMDDPRDEDVDNIIDDMVGEGSNYIRKKDRKEAIYYALDNALDNSIVLILGKGRDNYMAIGNEKIDYSDYEVIKKYFEA